MKNINIIAAIGQNRELGYQNELLWHLKKDLQFFKEKTMYHPIIMGRKTLESLPKLLPNREHLVLSHQNLTIPGVKVFATKEELDFYLTTLNDTAFVIGGSSLYQLYLLDAQKMYLTEIEDTKPADVFFPEFNQNDYEKQEIYTGIEQDITFHINEYTLKRKK